MAQEGEEGWCMKVKFSSPRVESKYQKQCLKNEERKPLPVKHDI